MPVERARPTLRRFAVLLAIAAIGFLVSGIVAQPAQAADDPVAAAAAAVAAMEAAGMQCRVDSDGTRCQVGAECGAGPDDPCGPATDDGPWAVGAAIFEEAFEGEPPVLFVNLSYFPGGTSSDPSGARPFFQSVIGAVCPDAAAAADAWVSAPESFAMVQGNGCAVELDAGTDSLVPDMHIYSLHFELDPGAVAPSATSAPAAAAPSTELAADAVEVFLAAGMDCISDDDETGCNLGGDCEFLPSGNYGCFGVPGNTLTIGHVDHAAIGDGDVSANHAHPAPAPDPTVIQDLFDDLIEVACPGAAGEAAGWFTAPTAVGAFAGDGCTAVLTSESATLTGGDVEQRYNLTFVPSGPAAPVASPSEVVPGTSPVAAAPDPSALPAAGENGAVIPPGGFVASITTLSSVTTDPTVVLQTAVLALLILFLMPFPAQLFNSTVEDHRDEIRGWFAPLTRGMRSVGSGIGAFWRSPVGIVAFLVVSALLYALLDPSFSLSVDGLITIIGILAGLVVVAALFSVPAVLWHGRRGNRPVLEAIPFTLVIAVFCVAISRLADFQPGYLYGLIIGIGFARTLDPAGAGRSGATAAAVMLVSALLAWVGLGLMVDAGIEGFIGVILATILAAVMVAGLEGVAFGLLPIRSLPGEPIYAWNRIVWGALIFVGLFAFMHVLINPQSGYLGDTSRTPLVTMLALLIGFAVLSVGFWGYFRFRPERVEA